MAPLFAEDATGSVAVANVQVWSSHLSSREDNFTCSYTAAPPDVLRVDEKHLREYSVPNCCGVGRRFSRLGR
jgi:hypothetical protein